jgi:hypothetical protein
MLKCDLCGKSKLRKDTIAKTLEAVYRLGGYLRQERLAGSNAHVSCITEALRKRKREAEKRGLAAERAP